MRARYCAYALGLVDYVIETTCPGGPQWRPDVAAWREELLRYCSESEFLGLEVLPNPQSEAATPGRTQVRFRARLRQGGQPHSFGERSDFVHIGGRWLYHSGQAL